MGVYVHFIISGNVFAKSSWARGGVPALAQHCSAGGHRQSPSMMQGDERIILLLDMLAAFGHFLAAFGRLAILPPFCTFANLGSLWPFGQFWLIFYHYLTILPAFAHYSVILGHFLLLWVHFWLSLFAFFFRPFSVTFGIFCHF